MTKGCGLDGSHYSADLLDSIHTPQHSLLQKILGTLNVGTGDQPDPTVREHCASDLSQTCGRGLKAYGI